MLKSASGRGAPMPRTPHRACAVGGLRRAPEGTIALLQSNSLPTLVQRELERMILAGDLAAGAKLNEATIAELLGVSRGPVREAFRALEESGLVRLEKNRGVFVRQIAVEEADEIYELRAVLDEYAGRRVAQSVAPADTAHAARAGRAHGPRRRARRRRRLPCAQPRVPRPAGRARRQRQAARDVPPAGQRAAPLPPRDARAGRHAAGLGARAPRHRREDRRRTGRGRRTRAATTT